MKKLFYLLPIFFLTSHSLKAQVKPIYFYGNTITSDKEKATSYGIYGKLSTEDLWMFKRYDLYNNLIQTGSYKDEGLTTPHGMFVFYMDIEAFNVQNLSSFKIKDVTRFMSQKGNFVNGLEEGKWLSFYPDGNVFNEQNFVKGVLQGEFKTFNKYGEVMILGNYKDGVRDGEWLFIKEDIKEIYENGKLIRTESLKKSKVTVRANS